MGFYRRGRWPRKNAKGLVEDAPSLDLHHLHRMANLRQWSVFTLNLPKLTIQGEANPERIKLTYPDRTGETLLLSWPRCGLGGTRPTAGCPGCGRGVLRLFFVGGRFKCRKCHGLQYLTTRLDDMTSARVRQGRARQKLGEDGLSGFLEPAPERPPGMWVRNYLNLLDRFDDAQGRAMVEMGKRLGRIARMG